MGGWGVVSVQIALILYLTHSAFSLTTFTEHTYHTRDSYSEKTHNKCNTDKKIFDFESVGYLPVRRCGSLNQRSSKCLQVPRQRGEDYADFGVHLLNSTKCGILMYQLFIVTLVKCGDIELNPGPGVNLGKKYNIKFPCLQCRKGINRRGVSCVYCGELSHIRCVENLTIENMISTCQEMKQFLLNVNFVLPIVITIYLMFNKMYFIFALSTHIKHHQQQ